MQIQISYRDIPLCDDIMIECIKLLLKRISLMATQEFNERWIKWSLLLKKGQL